VKGSPIVSAGAIWIETDHGLWVKDDTSAAMRLVSSHSGYVAGGCV